MSEREMRMLIDMRAMLQGGLDSLAVLGLAPEMEVTSSAKTVLAVRALDPAGNLRTYEVSVKELVEP